MGHSSLTARCRAVLAQQGIGGFCQAVRRRVYDRHKSIWFELPLADAPEVIAPKFDGRMDFENQEAVREYILRKNVPGTADPLELESMRKRGHLFGGVMDGEAIVGFIKIGWETVYVLDFETDITVRPGDFFVIDIYVGPEMRGKGAGPFLVSATSLEMRRRGFKRGVMHVRQDKTPMLRSCARTGYREIGRVDYTSIFGKQVFRPHPSVFFGNQDSN